MYRWIHVDCDPDMTEASYQRLVEDSEAKFTCILCDERKLASAISKIKKAAEDEFVNFHIVHVGEKRHRLVVPALIEKDHREMDDE
jgi:hypothetical protein